MSVRCYSTSGATRKLADLRSDAICATCPTGTICDAGTEIENMRMDVGYYRMTRFTTDVHRCQFYDDPSRTPCLGGLAGDALCGRSDEQHGPLCRLW